MSPAEHLTGEEVDELSDFLISEVVPAESMPVPFLDGFLATIAVNPNKIMPSQWLPRVWDIENAKALPKFSSTVEASRITGYIMRHYNTVLQSIDEGWFEPLCVCSVLPDAEECFDTKLWCDGFMFGVSMFPDAWRNLEEKHIEMIAPMVLLASKAGNEALDGGDDGQRIAREIYEVIPEAIAGLHAYFKSQRDGHIAGANPPASAAMVSPLLSGGKKIGRNAICPCGSGMKYKKCCGTETLH